MELEPEGIVPPDDDAKGGGDGVTQQIEALLDEDRCEEALRLIGEAVAAGKGNPLDLAFLAGDAYMAMGQARRAEAKFREVLAQDPDCASSRCWLAMSLFLQWRFDEAEVAVQAALEVPEPIADVHAVHGALLERRGEFDAAEASFERAATVAPDKYWLPERMTRQEFDREVRRAARKLPRQFRQALDRVPVVVQDVPEPSLAEGDEGDEVAPDILGLFVGVPLPETSDYELPQLRPNTIYLFQRNLERAAHDREDLIEQIRITLWHELAHYLGFEEEDMEDLGLE
ncbi:MAG: metallopeptidase family protein [Planctomycetes bacterium]|nr:metallopeptidase family protein [Planctomycetota bacterium]MCB9883846.1 metallopeptidase family protein [Planctomycetota bacterium]